MFSLNKTSGADCYSINILNMHLRIQVILMAKIHLCLLFEKSNYFKPTWKFIAWCSFLVREKDAEDWEDKQNDPDITCNMFPEHCDCTKLVLPAVQAWSIGGAGVLWCGWKSAGIPQWLNSGGRRCLVWDVGDEGEDAGVERVTGTVWGKEERAELGWEGAEGTGVIGIERAVDISRPSEAIRLWNCEESLRGRARTPQEPWEMSSSFPSGSSLRSALEMSILARIWGCLCEYVLSVRCPTEDGGVRGGCGDGGDGGKASSEVGSRLGSSSRLERVSADSRPLSRSTTPPGMLRQSTASTGPSSAITLRHAKDSGYEPMACRTRTSSSASSEVGNSSLFLPVMTKNTWIIEYQMIVKRQTKQRK